MKRIDTSTRAIDLFGAGKDGFKDGNLALGVAPTDFNASWPNMIQEEIANVIEDLGAALNPASRTQLRDALRGRLSSTLRVFGSSGTYTPTVGTKFIRVRQVGGGGAGGGAVVTGAGACSGGLGGGSGAFLEAFLLSGFAGQTMTVGTGGTPVAGASGGAGGATIFAGLTAGGGIGGQVFGPGAIPLTAAQTNTAVATGGSLNIPGQNGGGLFIIASSAGLSGIGANGLWGNGGGPSNGGDGAVGQGFGAGGSGALSYSSVAVTRSGGAGRPGLIIIEEFF